MKKFFIGMLVAVLVLSTFFMTRSATAKESKILEFSTMVGVPRPFTGAANAIRNVPGGGRPWVIGAAEGELKANGELELKVRGLVIDPNEPVATAGTNPSANFKVIVSCMSKDMSGAAVISNVETALFPADAMGNAEVETSVMLPSPCIAPIIFVTSATGSWFAATGN
jgi:predicted nicotinamide N-methyase